ncbi:MAG: DinB family protein [Bacteroidota bacterium]
MKVLILLFGLIPYWACAQKIDLGEWQTKWDNSKAYLFELVELADTLDLDYRPTPDQMSLRGQLTHIAKNMYFLSGRYLEYQPDSFDKEAIFIHLDDKELSIEEIKQELEQAFSFAEEAIKAVPPGGFDTMVQFFAGPKSKRVIAWLLQDHVTHHRGQLIVYLRLLGLKELPRYRGW